LQFYRRHICVDVYDKINVGNIYKTVTVLKYEKWGIRKCAAETINKIGKYRKA
jgi:hypothetical protein